MKTPEGERRVRTRAPRFVRHEVTVSYSSEAGPRTMKGRVIDGNEGGWGIELPSALPLGTSVLVAGEGVAKESSGQSQVGARVVWCVAKGSSWRLGLSRSSGEDRAEEAAGPAKRIQTTTDYYEVMQLSPNADQDTIHRVYRLLAQRYHPDNRESGDANAFQGVLEAYGVLGNAEKRAGYDADHQAVRRRRWKIFDQPKTAQGVEAEKRKRHGILGLLYAKRSNEPGQPAMSLFELEDLLGVAREHLEFSLWYLKEHTLISRADNARYSITARGVDEFEKNGPLALRADRLLPEPAAKSGPAAA